MTLVIGNPTGTTDIIAAKRIVIYQEIAPKYIKKRSSPIVKIDTKKRF